MSLALALALALALDPVSLTPTLDTALFMVCQLPEIVVHSKTLFLEF